LVRDYYKRACGIELLDFEREELWWERGGDLYLQNFERAGFVEVGASLREHDVILMQVASSKVNHSAVYVGGGVILQHLMGRLSSRDVYGGYWQKCTRKAIRHRQLV
jgi:cell wall-associated NlpC family hydrolase